MEERGAEKATHRQYEIEAGEEGAPSQPSPSQDSRKHRFSSESGSRAWGQASHRRLTDSEFETADRQDDDWVSLLEGKFTFENNHSTKLAISQPAISRLGLYSASAKKTRIIT